MTWILSLVLWALSNLVARVLLGAGLAFASYGAITALVDGLIDVVRSQVGGVPADLLGLAGLAGIWEGMGIILGAYIASASIAAARVVLTRVAA